MANKRIYGLDLFRVISVLAIFLFHSHIHIGCSYGVLNTFINSGAIFMTAFFLLSGYVIYYTSAKYEFCGGG